MAEYEVRTATRHRLVQACSHRQAVRRSGLAGAGELVWVDGPLPGTGGGRAIIQFLSTHHRPPQLRRRLVYIYGLPTHVPR